MAAPSPTGLLKNGALVGTWDLDPRRSSIRLKTRTIWSLVPVRGAFGEFSGTCEVSADGTATGSLRVAAASIDTKNARRDKHLRSADFFDSDNHPDIVFTADAIRPAGQGVTVTGTLTVCERSMPMSFDAGLSVQGDDEISLDAEVQVDRADLGLTWNVLRSTSTHNTLTVHTVLTRRFSTGSA